MNKDKMFFYEFNDATSLCKFVNNNDNITPVSVVFNDYKYKLFFLEHER